MAEGVTSNDLGLSRLKQIIDQDFWKRPEGKVGMVVLALIGLGLAGGIAINLMAILNYVLSVLQTMTSIVIHLGFLFGSYMVATNKMVRALIGAGYRGLIRKLAAAAVDFAPVALARYCIARSKERLANAEAAATRFKAKMLAFFKVIKDFEAKLRQQEALARKLGRSQDPEERNDAVVKQSLAERTRARIKKLSGMYVNLETAARALDTGIKKVRRKIEMTEENVEDDITVYEVMTEAREAKREAIAAISSTSAEAELLGMSRVKMAAEIANSVVELEELVDIVNKFDDVDAEEAVFNEAAVVRLQQNIQEWEKRSESSVFAPGEKTALAQAAADPNQAYDLEKTPTVTPAANRTARFNAKDFFSR